MPDDEIRARLNRLEMRQEALIAGCAAMNDTLATLRDAVGELAGIMNEPASGDLPDLLAKVATGLQSLTEGFIALDRRVAALPERLAKARGEPQAGGPAPAASPAAASPAGAPPGGAP